MSYKTDLEDHYKRVRERMRMGVKTPIIPKPLIAAFVPVGGVAGGTGIAPPVEAVSLETENRRQGQLNNVENKNRIDTEAAEAPKLPPLMMEPLDGPFSKWRQLVATVSRRHDVSAKEVLGLSRRRPVIEARFECMYRMRMELCMSYLSIGGKMGRDHSTVMHGVNVIRERLLDAAKKREQSGQALAHGIVPKQSASSCQLAAA